MTRAFDGLGHEKFILRLPLNRIDFEQEKFCLGYSMLDRLSRSKLACPTTGEGRLRAELDVALYYRPVR